MRSQGIEFSRAKGCEKSILFRILERGHMRRYDGHCYLSIYGLLAFCVLFLDRDFDADSPEANEAAGIVKLGLAADPEMSL